MPTVALDIAPGMVPAVETNGIIVPAATEYDLPVIRFTNKDVNPHQLTIWNKTSVGAGVDADLESPPITIQAQSVYEYGPLVLAAGRVISWKADAVNVISVRPHGWATT